MLHAFRIRHRTPQAPSESHLKARLRDHVLGASQRGQTLIEFAVVTTIAIAMMMATLQVSLIMVQRYGAAQVARETARWLAVRIDTTDASVLAQARVFATGLPGLDTTGMPSVTVSPSCPSLSGGQCTGRNQGDAVTVTVNTSLTPIMFLPTSYGIAPFRITFPASMPAISYTVLLE